jgi:hypothetical protein
MSVIVLPLMETLGLLWAGILPSDGVWVGKRVQRGYIAP